MSRAGRWVTALLVGIVLTVLTGVAGVVFPPKGRHFREAVAVPADRETWASLDTGASATANSVVSRFRRGAARSEFVSAYRSGPVVVPSRIEIEGSSFHLTLTEADLHTLRLLADGLDDRYRGASTTFGIDDLYDLVVRVHSRPTAARYEIGFPLSMQTGWQHPWPDGPEHLLEYRPGGRRVVRIPLRPEPLGWLANVVFWTIVASAVRLVIVAVRGWHRRRRGLCPRCAYPRGESPVCTECGAA